MDTVSHLIQIGNRDDSVPTSKRGYSRVVNHRCFREIRRKRPEFLVADDLELMRVVAFDPAIEFPVTYRDAMQSHDPRAGCDADNRIGLEVRTEIDCNVVRPVRRMMNLVIDTEEAFVLALGEPPILDELQRTDDLRPFAVGTANLDTKPIL